MASKIWDSAQEALSDIVFDGMTVAVGGFGLSGIPTNLIRALRETGVAGLTVVSNNMGVDGEGLGLMLENGQVSRVLASCIRENELFVELYTSGALDVEFVPQGTLAKRLRAVTAVIPAFFTPTGVGTPVADGKYELEFDGTITILKCGIMTDLALVRAREADCEGNLRYRPTARNFNPLVATASKVTVAETETLGEGHLDPNEIHTPGIFVQRLVVVTETEKDIQQRTVRPRVYA